MKENLIGGEEVGSSKRFFCLIFFMALSLIFLITTIVFVVLYINSKGESDSEKTNSTIPYEPKYPSEDRFIKVLSKMTELGGAYVTQGKHDITNSSYFKYIDIYNMKSSGSLILLEKFKTYQQTSDVSCGPASLIMAVYYLDGTILDEVEVAKKAGTNENGTEFQNLEKAITEFGYSFDSKSNYTDEELLPSRSASYFAKYIKESLKNNESIIVASNDWGGHYSVIIGYDDMGTSDYISDDIIILADPYDTSDHMSDGYTIFSYERFYSQFMVNISDIPNHNLYFNRIKRKNSN